MAWCDDPPQAHATPVFAGSGRVFDETVLIDQKWIFHFDSFDRQVRGVGDVHLDTVFAVFGGSCPHTSAEGFEIKVRLTRSGVGSGEYCRCIGTVRRSNDAFREGGGQCTENHVNDSLAGVGACRNRCWKGAVDQRATRCQDLY